MNRLMIPTFTIGTKSLGDFVHAVVTMVEAQVETSPIRYRVHCRRRPGRKPCGEPVVAFVDLESGTIHYHCPKCGDSGLINRGRSSQPKDTGLDGVLSQQRN